MLASSANIKTVKSIMFYKLTQCKLFNDLYTLTNAFVHKFGRMNLKHLLLAITFSLITTPLALAQNFSNANNNKHHPHHIAQPWHNPHYNKNYHSGSDSNSAYVRHTGPRYNGPHWQR